MKNSHTVTPENKRVIYTSNVDAELVRMRAAAAAALREFDVTMLRAHDADAAARVQASQYFNVVDADGGSYSVSVKVVKESQAVKVSARAAQDAAAAYFADFVVDYALTNGKDAARALTARRAALTARIADAITSNKLRPTADDRAAAFIDSLI